MQIMRNFAKEGKSILFITHKLNEIMAVADRCSVLRKGKYISTVDIKDTTKEEIKRNQLHGYALHLPVGQGLPEAGRGGVVQQAVRYDRG